MRCDKCGIALTVANTAGHAPYGIPLFVCKSCYNKLKESEKDLQKEYEENRMIEFEIKNTIQNAIKY